MWAGSTRGPIAPPGKYRVRLSANNVTKTQDFAIVRNAAVPSVTDADLIAQFTLAKQISDKLTVANEAVIRIRSLKDQIAERLSKTSDAALKSSAQSLVDKLTSIEGEIYQYRNRSNQDPLNYPIRLNNKLAALQGVVETGDVKPTDQAQAMFKDLSARLDKQLARLEALVKSELAATNALLAAQKLEPISADPARR
jgi:transketolase